jgi:predicted O-linked N-acetylglucosamine transferase (SPINDLY family)
MSTVTLQQLLARAVEAQQRGQFDAAVAAADAVISAQPSLGSGHALRGMAMSQLKRHAEAIASMQRFVDLAPSDPNAPYALAQVLGTAGERERAEEVLVRLIAVNPGHRPAWVLLGQVRLERGNHSAAADAWIKALAMSPQTMPPAQRSAIVGNVGACLSDAGRLAEAVPYLKQAADESPTHAGRQLNYARALIAAARFDDAERAIRATVALEVSARAVMDLASVLGEQGRIDEALPLHKQAIDLEPENPSHWSNYFLSLRYSDKHSLDEVFDAHQPYREKFKFPPVTFANTKDPTRKLRVGYLSPDLRSHPVASFIEGILRSHDRQRFSIHAYSTAPREDEVSAKLKALVGAWRTVPKSVSHDALAEQIRADGIDILIDLSGHTAHNRMAVLARRAASIQGLYLGYPGTSGLDAVDFFITDSIVDPPGNDRFYTERLLRVDEGSPAPRPFLAFSPNLEAPAPTPLPALANGFVTFGSLGNLAKVTPTTLAMWRSLLLAVPTSRLLIRGRAGASPAAQQRILRGLANVDPARVTFHGWSPQGSRWGLHQQIDIALDTYPYHGTTTTCESLWMGLPTVLRVGPIHAARVGKTLLHAIGLDELAAESAEDFTRVALALATDLPRLASLRSALRERMRASPLCDATSLTRAIESRLREQWRHYCDDGQNHIQSEPPMGHR